MAFPPIVPLRALVRARPSVRTVGARRSSRTAVVAEGRPVPAGPGWRLMSGPRTVEEHPSAVERASSAAPQRDGWMAKPLHRLGMAQIAPFHPGYWEAVRGDCLHRTSLVISLNYELPLTMLDKRVCVTAGDRVLIKLIRIPRVAGLTLAGEWRTWRTFALLLPRTYRF